MRKQKPILESEPDGRGPKPFSQKQIAEIGELVSELGVEITAFALRGKIGMTSVCRCRHFYAQGHQVTFVVAGEAQNRIT